MPRFHLSYCNDKFVRTQEMMRYRFWNMVLGIRLNQIALNLSYWKA